MKNSIDPFTVEVIRHALTAAAEEMSFVVMRSARSPLLREAGDLSSALTDHKGDLIAQGRDIPIHLGVMSFTVKKFLERVPAERLQPGDVWYLNLPEVGGNHLPDVKAIRPIFLEGRLFAFAVSLAHWGDIGGAWAGSYFAAATETWQEGVRIPPLRLFTADGVDQEKLDFLLANLRGPAEREGDILAQIAATRAAEARWSRLLRGAWRGHDPRRARPAGRSFRSADARGDRGPARRRSTRARTSSTTTARGGRARSRPRADRDRGRPGALRLQRDRRCRRGPAQHDALRRHGRGLLRHQGGGRAGDPAQRRLLPCRSRSRTRPGSLLEPGIDKPVVGGNHETSQRAVDAIMQALEPGRAGAADGGRLDDGRAPDLRRPRRDGAMGTFYETHGGGEGARAERDGVPVVRVHLTNTMNTPAEIVEAEYMIRVEEQRLRPQLRRRRQASRRRRAVRTYTVLADGLTLTTMFERRVVPPYGLQGGGDGAPFRVTLHRAAAAAASFPARRTLPCAMGDRVVMETSGGGGYGVVSSGEE